MRLSFGAQNAIRLNPDHSSAHNNLGCVLRDVRSDLDGAEKAFRAALAANPKHEKADANLFKLLRVHNNKGEESSSSPSSAAKDDEGDDTVGGDDDRESFDETSQDDARGGQGGEPTTDDGDNGEADEANDLDSAIGAEDTTKAAPATTPSKPAPPAEPGAEKPTKTPAVAKDKGDDDAACAASAERTELEYDVGRDDVSCKDLDS